MDIICFWEQLSKKSGRVFSLYFGGRPAVILTGSGPIKEELVSNGVDFGGRPRGLLLSHLTHVKGKVQQNTETWLHLVVLSDFQRSATRN